VDNQETGSPGRPVSSGLQVLGEPGHCATRRQYTRVLKAYFVCIFVIFTLVSVNKIFFSPGATDPIGGCILQPSSGL